MAGVFETCGYVRDDADIVTFEGMLEHFLAKIIEDVLLRGKFRACSMGPIGVIEGECVLLPS